MGSEGDGERFVQPELVFGERIEVQCVLLHRRAFGASAAERVIESIIVDGGPCGGDSEGETICVAGNLGGVVVAKACAEVIGELVYDEQDWVMQVFSGPERGEGEFLVVVLPRCLVGDPDEVEVAFPVAVDVIEDLCASVALGLSRVVVELGLGEVAGQFGVGECDGEVEPGFQLVVEAVSDIGEEALVALFAVVAEPVLRDVGQAEEVVVRA